MKYKRLFYCSHFDENVKRKYCPNHCFTEEHDFNETFTDCHLKYNQKRC